MTRWLARGLAAYDRLHDDLAADGTSRLGAYLHFGCLSPLELAERASGREGAEPFVRQLCWRDFYAQLLAARPEISHADFRPRGHRWRDDAGALAAWKEGRTGYPIIDAGMRQLAREGFMHNRARLLTGSFLTKDLYLDWRLGAAHFAGLLVDGDVASNSGNWQWVAGTGVDTRPNRVFNPISQARRFDPSGDYVRRYVPELAGIEGSAVHEPWKLARAAAGLSRADRRSRRSGGETAQAQGILGHMTFAAPARQLLRAKDLADARYAEPLDVATLARAARLSQAHFSREFRRVFGESPHQYLLTRRLERAAALLRSTDRSVADICITVGLHSVGSFTTSFRRAYGQSPTQYRAAYPPAASRARIPTCMQRVWARPVSSKLTQEEKRA